MPLTYPQVPIQQIKAGSSTHQWVGAQRSPINMRRRQQLTPSSSSSSDSDGSDIESCFDTRDEQEETDAKTEPTDVNADVDEDDEADLPDLEWLAKEKNAYLLEYYLDQKNNSDESKDKDKDYSDDSLFLLDMIKRNFYQ